MALLSVGCASPTEVPQITVQPMTEAAREINDLYILITVLAALVFVGVQAALVYVMWRFRERPGNELPPQIHGNTYLEIGWTILPAIVLVVIAIPTIRTIFALESGAPPGSNPLVIEVVGKQWWWEYRYPEQNLITANEMVLPVGRTVELRMTSDNVIHSFWVPQLMGKQDLMPTHVTTLWFTPEQPGQYWGQCAEYCGIQHANMRMNVIVMNQGDWQAWVTRNQRPAQPSTDLALEGEQVFLRSACVGCHTIQGTSAQARAGPDLSHFGSRTTVAAGILPNTTENLRAWLQDPQHVKPGNLMPNLLLRPSEVDALVEYLHSLK